MNNQIQKILAISTLIEATITYIDSAFFNVDHFPYQMFLSLLFGMIFAICYKLDILEMVDIKSDIPYVGSIFTGILFSRGSNYIFDLISNTTNK